LYIQHLLQWLKVIVTPGIEYHIPFFMSISFNDGSKVTFNHDFQDPLLRILAPVVDELPGASGSKDGPICRWKRGCFR